ncbi:hypothetical protein J6590_107091, partial [Homalodisca vitripennis]
SPVTAPLREVSDISPPNRITVGMCKWPSAPSRPARRLLFDLNGFKLDASSHQHL